MKSAPCVCINRPHHAHKHEKGVHAAEVFTLLIHLREQAGEVFTPEDAAVLEVALSAGQAPVLRMLSLPPILSSAFNSAQVCEWVLGGFSCFMHSLTSIRAGDCDDLNLRQCQWSASACKPAPTHYSLSEPLWTLTSPVPPKASPLIRVSWPQAQEAALKLADAIARLPGLQRINGTALAPLTAEASTGAQGAASSLDISGNALGPLAGGALLARVPNGRVLALQALNLTGCQLAPGGAAALASKVVAAGGMRELQVCLCLPWPFV